MNIAAVASLIGDPTRARMLTALMDGRARTAKELAYGAAITPQTASSHLAKLLEARLLAMERQSRHRYFRLAAPSVGQAVEALMAVMRKMLLVAYRLLRTEETYDPRKVGVAPVPHPPSSGQLAAIAPPAV